MAKFRRPAVIALQELRRQQALSPCLACHWDALASFDILPNHAAASQLAIYHLPASCSSSDTGLQDLCLRIGRLNPLSGKLKSSLDDPLRPFLRGAVAGPFQSCKLTTLSYLAAASSHLLKMARSYSMVPPASKHVRLRMAQVARVCPLGPGMHGVDERYYVFECPAFDGIRRGFQHLFGDSLGAMRRLMWHPCQKDVASCLLQLLDRIDETLT